MAVSKILSATGALFMFFCFQSNSAMAERRATVSQVSTPKVNVPTSGAIQTVAVSAEREISSQAPAAERVKSGKHSRPTKVLPKKERAL